MRVAARGWVAGVGLAWVLGACAGVVDPLGADPGAVDRAPAAGLRPTAAQVAQARTELGRLPVAPARGDGYERTTDFGPAWVLDEDHNGCRQRDDVLRRDLRNVHTSGRCIVVSGTLDDPYTGTTVTFTKADAAQVQIDHVYPLGLAWRHGAASWPKQRRIQFANDLANLVATTGAANDRKSDKGPAEWLPPNHGFWCAYAVRYTTVTASYGLSVSSADRAALTRALATCPKT